MCRWILIVLLFTRCFGANAQDPLFSQFYFSPVYLNPAFTGTGKNDFRASFNSRIQWMNLPQPFQYYTLSADKYFARPKASLGIMANRFNEGYLKTSQVYGLLAKNFGAGECDDGRWFLNFAFEMGAAWRNADRSKFLFPDQIDVNGPNGQPSQFELFKYAGKPYFDIGFGFVFTYDNWMFGAAGHHLNKPVDGLIGSAENSRLPRRYTFHLSYINDETASDDFKILAKPSIVFNAQGDSRSLMVGSLFDFPEWVLGGGVWYKNNFGSKNSFGIAENHTICIGITFKLSQDKNYFNADPGIRWNTGVSYEAEINRPGIKQTKGSMEMGMMLDKNWSNDGTCPKPYCGPTARYPWVFF